MSSVDDIQLSYTHPCNSNDLLVNSNWLGIHAFCMTLYCIIHSIIDYKKMQPHIAVLLHHFMSTADCPKKLYNNLSHRRNLQTEIIFVIMTHGYYSPDLHLEVYIDSFNDSYMTNHIRYISSRRNTICTTRISCEVTIL